MKSILLFICSNSLFALLTKSIGPNRTSPNCTILDNRVFGNFILVNEPFAKVLRIFETCVNNNNLCGKLVSSIGLSIKFDERFEVTSVQFFWQILAYEAVNLTTLHLTCYIKSFYINILLKQNKIVIL